MHKYCNHIILSDYAICFSKLRHDDERIFVTDRRIDSSPIIFQFMNSFFSLFYIAFYLQDLVKLREQLATLLITRQFIGNIKEIVTPFINAKVRQMVMGIKYEHRKNTSLELLKKSLDAKSDATNESKCLTDSELPAVLSSVVRPESLSITEDVVLKSHGEEKSASSSETLPQTTIEDNRMESSNDRLLRRRLNVRSRTIDKVEVKKSADRRFSIGSKRSSTCAQYKTDSYTRRTDKEQKSSNGSILSTPSVRISRDSKRSLINNVYPGEWGQLIAQEIALDNQLALTPGETALYQAEEEATLPKYDDPFEDFLEMFIQFGYVSMFACAFPLAGLFCLLNNILEIRSDAFKLISGYQRPFGANVPSIGVWQIALEGLSYVSVVVNMGLLAVSGGLARILDGFSSIYVILGIVVIEHMVIVIKFLLEQSIPDVPYWIEQERFVIEHKRREAYKAIEREAMKERRRHRGHSYDPIDNKDDVDNNGPRCDSAVLTRGKTPV